MLAAGVAEDVIDGGVRLAGDVAEGIVNEVVGNRRDVEAGVVLGQVADRAQVVGERPEDVARGVFVSQDLVDLGAVEVAVSDGARDVEREDYVVASIVARFAGAVVDVVDLFVDDRVAVGVEELGDAAVEGIVDVLDMAGNRAAGRGPFGDGGEAVAVVPGVLGDRGVARVEEAVGVGVAESGGAVAFGVVAERQVELPVAFAPRWMGDSASGWSGGYGDRGSQTIQS